RLRPPERPRNATPGGTAPRRVRPRSPSLGCASRRAEREPRPGAMLPRRRPTPSPQEPRANGAASAAMSASASGGGFEAGARGGDAGEGAVPAEDLQRLEQRQPDGAAGDGDADGRL